MKIIGGNFGTSGHVAVTEDGTVKIKSSRSKDYSRLEIATVSAETTKDRKFGVIGAILGAILFSVLLAPFLGVLGVIIALAVAVLGSFYSKKKHTGQIQFKDGQAVTLDLDSWQVDRLYRLPPED
jgi:hypothetical protein